MSQTLTKPETQPVPEPTHGLPSPRDFPKADVVIFDGNCNFCIGQVKNVRRFDGKNRVSFISLHDNFVAENFPDLTYDQMMSQIYLVPGGDRGEHQYSDSRHGGAAAIAYLTRRLPLLWIFAPLLNFPFRSQCQSGNGDMELLLEAGIRSRENEESNAMKTAAANCISEIKSSNKLPCRFL